MKSKTNAVSTAIKIAMLSIFLMAGVLTSKAECLLSITPLTNWWTAYPNASLVVSNTSGWEVIYTKANFFKYAPVGLANNDVVFIYPGKCTGQVAQNWGYYSWCYCTTNGMACQMAVPLPIAEYSNQEAYLAQELCNCPLNQGYGTVTAIPNSGQDNCAP